MLGFIFVFVNGLADIYIMILHILHVRATDIRAGLGKKNGLSKISHARMYSKFSKETFQFAKVLDLVSGACMCSFNRECTFS
jgi:hypothetical protein